MTSSQRVERAVRAVAEGQFVIVTDDESRENEGDLILAAEKVDAERMAFMVRHTSGIVCAPMEDERLDALGLGQMVEQNTARHGTAFTVSVDLLGGGTTTGVSAADRAATVKALCCPHTRPEDLARPGHIFPLRANPGGVFARPGHTEASIGLARLAGLYPAAILCELVNDDGTMMRGERLQSFATEHGLELISVDDLVAYGRPVSGPSSS